MTTTSYDISHAGIAPGDPVLKLVARTPVYVGLDTSLRNAAQVMAEEFIGAVLVRGPHGPAGILSERDIVTGLAEGADPDTDRARDLMTPDLASVLASETILDAGHRMLGNEIRHLLVTTAGGSTVGLVSVRDVLAVLSDEVRPRVPFTP
jgi:CBS domain-containing protein